MSHTGYLTIDHRASPGVPGNPMLKEGSFFEADTRICGHCSIPVIMNPFRTRERAKTKNGDYLCDVCAAAYKINGICRPWSQVVEDQLSGKTTVPLLARDMKG